MITHFSMEIQGQLGKPVQERFVPIPYANDIYAASKKAGVSPFLVAAVVRVESDFKWNALSYANCMGLMQISQTVSLMYGNTNQSPLNIKHNLYAGSMYLSSLIHLYSGDTGKALVAYNEGLKWVNEGIYFPSSVKYSKKVLMYYFHYRWKYHDKFTR